MIKVAFHSIGLTLWLLLLHKSAHSAESEYVIDATCSHSATYNPVKVENDTIKIVWNGTFPFNNTYKCTQKYTAEDHHILCMEAELFVMTSPGVQLNFFEGNISNVVASFSFNDSTYKVCTSSDEIAFVQISGSSSVTHAQTNGSHVIVKLWSIEPINHLIRNSDYLMTIIIVGFVCLIGAAVAHATWTKYRRRETVRNTDTTPVVAEPVQFQHLTPLSRTESVIRGKRIRQQISAVGQDRWSQEPYQI